MSDDVEKLRTCTKCRECKPLSDYPRHKNFPDGRFSWCKSCKRLNDRARYATNSRKAIQQSKEWRQKNPDKARELKRRYYAKDRVRALYAALRSSQRGRGATGYIRALLRLDGVPSAAITQELVDARRAYLVVNRQLRSMK